jgi:hypothetical protein
LIFLSYRRDDSKDVVDRLELELKNKYGADINVFRDINAITPGEKFLEKLEFAVSQSLVFLAIIGKEWAGPPGQQCRLSYPDYFVRRGIEFRF